MRKFLRKLWTKIKKIFRSKSKEGTDMAFGLQTFNKFGDATFDSTQYTAHLSEHVVRVGGFRHASSPIQVIPTPPDVPAEVPSEDLFIGLAEFFLENISNVHYTSFVYGNLPISVTRGAGNTLVLTHSALPGAGYQDEYYETQDIRVGWVQPL